MVCFSLASIPTGKASLSEQSSFWPFRLTIFANCFAVNDQFIIRDTAVGLSGNQGCASVPNSITVRRRHTGFLEKIQHETDDIISRSRGRESLDNRADHLQSRRQTKGVR